MQSPPVDTPGKLPAAGSANASEAGAAFETLLRDGGGVAAADGAGAGQPGAPLASGSKAADPASVNGQAKAKPVMQLVASVLRGGQPGAAARTGLGLQLASALAATPHVGRMLGLPIAAAHEGLAANAAGSQQAPQAGQAHQGSQPKAAPQQAVTVSSRAMGLPHLGTDHDGAATSGKIAARTGVRSLRVTNGQTDARFSGQRVSVTVTPPGPTAHPGRTLDGATSLAAAAADELADGKASPTGGGKREQAATPGAVLVEAAEPDDAGERPFGKPARNMSRGFQLGGGRQHAMVPNTPAGQGGANQGSTAASISRLTHAAEGATAQPAAPQATASSSDLVDHGRSAVDPLQHASPAAGSDASGSAARPSAHAGTGVRPTTPPSPVAEQVAVQIQRAVGAGRARVSIQMHPPELGRIDVRLHLADDGSVRAAVSVDKPDTLELLQRDARGLERALNDAGLKTQSGGLDFGLRGHGDHGQPGERSAGAPPPLADDAEASTQAPEQPDEVPYASPASAGGIDIRV